MTAGGGAGAGAVALAGARRRVRALVLRLRRALLLVRRDVVRFLAVRGTARFAGRLRSDVAVRTLARAARQATSPP